MRNPERSSSSSSATPFSVTITGNRNSSLSETRARRRPPGSMLQPRLFLGSAGSGSELTKRREEARQSKRTRSSA